jgi:hypothetical protein
VTKIGAVWQAVAIQDGHVIFCVTFPTQQSALQAVEKATHDAARRVFVDRLVEAAQ